MLETYKIGITVDLAGNVQTGIDRLIAQVEALDRQVKGTSDQFARMVREISALGNAGRSIQSLNRAMDKLGTGGTKGLGELEKAAAATRSITEASERLNTVLRENARLAADFAKANQSAARSGGGGARSNSGPRQASGGHGAGGGLGGHDMMLAGMGASMVGQPLLRGGETAMERGIAMAGWRTALLADTRVSEKQADAAMNAAFAAAQSAPGTTPLGNAGNFAKLKTITGSFDEALEMLPKYAQLMTLLSTIDKRNPHGHGGDQGYAAAKASEILGMMTEDVVDPKTGTTNQVFHPELMNTAVERFGRIASAELGNVQPTDILAMAKQATNAGMVLSEQFLWEKLPALIQVWGGSRTGTALQSMVQVFGPGGKLEPKTYDNLARLGLADPAGHKRELYVDPLTGKKKVRDTIDPTKILNYGMLFTDPAEWAHKASAAMEGAGIHGSRDQALNIMSGAQRSPIARLFADLIKDYAPILKTQENIQAQRPDLAKYYAENDPSAKLPQLQASFDRLLTTLGGPATQDAVRVMDAATAGLNRLGSWAKEHPTMARVLTDTATALGGLATALGTISTAIFLFGPALKALGIAGRGAAVAEVAGGVAAPVAGGALGVASRLLMGTGVGAAAAAVGTALVVGSEYETPETRVAQEKLARQRRYDPMQTPQDGFGLEGPLPGGARAPQPVQLQGSVMLDGKKVGEIVANGIARSASGPNTGTTGFDIRAGVGGGIAVLP